MNDPFRLRRHAWRIASSMLIGLVVVASACKKSDDGDDPDRYAHVMTFDSARVRLIGRDTVPITVELARSEAQQTMGLMERRTLGASSGMLFLYSSVQPDSSAFWMFRTLIPLDIAFIDSVGTIRSLFRMEPCASTLAQGCPNYPAGARYQAALEMNAGFFAAHSIRVGDRVVLSDTADGRSPAGQTGR